MAKLTKSKDFLVLPDHTAVLGSDDRIYIAGGCDSHEGNVFMDDGDSSFFYCDSIVEVLKIWCTVPLSIHGFIPKYLWGMVLKFHTVTSETDVLTFWRIFLTVAAGLNNVCSLLI